MKGQSSLEFLAYVSMSMLILAVLYAVIADKQADTLEMQQRENVESISDKFSFNLEMALVQGEGYSRVFTLPGGIMGNNYTVELGSGGANVYWKDNSLYHLSRYQGNPMNVSVDSDSRVFRVKHNASGVFLIEA